MRRESDDHMTGILRSLIWKEWHELKWKAAALVAVAVALVVMSQGHRNLNSVLSGLRFLFLPLGAAFVAMSVGASESSRGSHAANAIAPKAHASPKLANRVIAVVPPGSSESHPS